MGGRQTIDRQTGILGGQREKDNDRDKEDGGGGGGDRQILGEMGGRQMTDRLTYWEDSERERERQTERRERQTGRQTDRC